MLVNRHTIKIAIDGPAAAGKSTVAKLVAQELSYIYIDTGAMYRAITLKALAHSIPLDNEAQLTQLLEQTVIKLKQAKEGQQVFLDGEDVTLQIRSQQVTNHVSYIAKLPKIRQEMVNRQQSFAKQGGVVMDGRDIGTYVLPNAEVKIFLVASVDERAKRRFKENRRKGIPSDLEEIKNEIRKRDQIDSSRKVSPLVKAEDAIEIDTTNQSIKQVAELILEEAYHVLKR
ncbi:(d)CMP kinase [Cerasibacillus terrae]|uniref:Cytidylate kinase n=1 Tax=Cerasibacillus terrae TaxID=2498845 RepID=A0A5C8P2V0_9BACI|nr:(d)CMP kinase [Cerasibacillus terrae]TXL67869.1 (d)CMP kinase [Cerasibacillus terrae]